MPKLQHEATTKSDHWRTKHGTNHRHQASGDIKTRHLGTNKTTFKHRENSEKLTLISTLTEQKEHNLVITKNKANDTVIMKKD